MTTNTETENSYFVTKIIYSFYTEIITPIFALTKTSFSLLKTLGTTNLILLTGITIFEFTFGWYIGLLLTGIVAGTPLMAQSAYLYITLGSIIGGLTLDSYKIYLFNKLDQSAEEFYKKDYQPYLIDPYVMIRYKEKYDKIITSEEIQHLIEKRNKAVKISWSLVMLVFRTLFLSGANMNFKVNIFKLSLKNLLKYLTGMVIINIIVSLIVNGLIIAIKYISSKIKEYKQKLNSIKKENYGLENQLSYNIKNAYKVSLFASIKENIDNKNSEIEKFKSNNYENFIAIIDNVLSKLASIIQKLSFIIPSLFMGGLSSIKFIDILILAIVAPIRQVVFGISRMESFFDQINTLKEARSSESKLGELKKSLEKCKNNWNISKRNLYKLFRKDSELIEIEKNAHYTLYDRTNQLEIKFNITNSSPIKLEEGKIYYLKGDSGIGKTTLMEAISQYNENSTGIYFNKKLNPIQPHSDPDFIFWVAQQKIPNISFKGNTVRNYLIGSKKLSTESQKELDRLSNYLEIKQKLDQNLNSLSGGQQARVMLLKALLSKAKVIFIDEGLSSFSESHKEFVLFELRKYVKENKAIIAYTHHTEKSIYIKPAEKQEEDLTDNDHTSVPTLINKENGILVCKRFADSIIYLKKDPLIPSTNNVTNINIETKVLNKNNETKNISEFNIGVI